jgi:hypothetical membrane protein
MEDSYFIRVSDYWMSNQILFVEGVMIFLFSALCIAALRTTNAFGLLGLFLPPSERRSEHETYHLPACVEMYVVCADIYSRTALIRTQAIRIANYPNRLGPSGKHFLAVILLRPFMT